MRQQHDVGQREQARVHGGFAFKHIESCAGEQALFEGRGERRFVDDRAARGVDEERRALHAAQLFDADQMARLLPQRHVQRHVITLL
jgi:hypothetical protein